MRGKLSERLLVHLLQGQSQWLMLWWTAATTIMTQWACWVAPIWMLASTPSLCRTSQAPQAFKTGHQCLE